METFTLTNDALKTVLKINRYRLRYFLQPVITISSVLTIFFFIKHFQGLNYAFIYSITCFILLIICLIWLYIYELKVIIPLKKQYEVGQAYDVIEQNHKIEIKTGDQLFKSFQLDEIKKITMTKAYLILVLTDKTYLVLPNKIKYRQMVTTCKLR